MKISDMTLEELSERLILSVINYNDSAERLLNFPHIRKGSFAVLTQLCMGEKNINGMYTTCLTVTNDMLNGWEISKDNLFSMATVNSKVLFPAVCEPITSYLSSESTDRMLTDTFDLSKVSVLTNDSFYNGVATLFYDSDILDEIAREAGTEKVYIMASSVNHMYCIPDNAGINKEELQEIFREFSNEIEKNDKACDSVLTYDSSNKKIFEADLPPYNLTLQTEQHVIKSSHR